MTALSELIARVEGAAGPDRELDWEIDFYFTKDKWAAESRGGALRREEKYPGEAAQYYENFGQPHYISSLDAVVVLVERETPQSSWGVYRMYSGRFTATTHDGDVRGEASTPALALLLAFLRSRTEGAPS